MPRQPKTARNRTRTEEPLSKEVKRLIKTVMNRDPSTVQKTLTRFLTQHTNAEFDDTATFFSGEWEPDIDESRVRHLLDRGQVRQAMNCIVRQVREEVTHELRCLIVPLNADGGEVLLVGGEDEDAPPVEERLLESELVS